MTFYPTPEDKLQPTSGLEIIPSPALSSLSRSSPRLLPRTVDIHTLSSPRVCNRMSWTRLIPVVARPLGLSARGINTAKCIYGSSPTRYPEEKRGGQISSRLPFFLALPTPFFFPPPRLRASPRLASPRRTVRARELLFLSLRAARD